jgi:type VI secretion system secreted protein VgrG
VSVSSSAGQISLAGKQEIILMAGGAYVRIKDGNIEAHCPGKLSIKGNVKMSGPTSMQIDSPAFPHSTPKFPIAIQLDQTPQGVKSSWVGMPYKLHADGVLKTEGVVDASGQIVLQDHSTPIQQYKLEMANGVVYDIPVLTAYRTPAEGEAANLGFHPYQPGAAPDNAPADTTPTTARKTFAGLLLAAQHKDPSHE